MSPLSAVGMSPLCLARPQGLRGGVGDQGNGAASPLPHRSPSCPYTLPYASAETRRQRWAGAVVRAAAGLAPQALLPDLEHYQVVAYWPGVLSVCGTLRLYFPRFVVLLPAVADDCAPAVDLRH